MDTFSELRQLADDLTELGDTATAALVRQAIDRWRSAAPWNSFHRPAAGAKSSIEIGLVELLLPSVRRAASFADHDP